MTNVVYKYIIVGFHASGKQEICTDLESLGVHVGKNFISLSDMPSDIYTIANTQYTSQDIDSMFENQAYIFIQQKKFCSTSYYEGISLYEFDNNDVVMMTPDQFNLIPHIPNNTIVIWLDNNTTSRRLRYLNERRQYNFTSEESFERHDLNEFINKVNDTRLIYFNNEDPLRVSAIIYSLVNHPELLRVYESRFI